MMLLETAQIYLQPGADATSLGAALCALPGHCAANLPGAYGAGDYTWDAGAEMARTAAATHAAAAQLAAHPAVARIDRVRYQPLARGARAPQLSGGIKRTLLLRVQPHASTADIAALEQDLLRMPRYLDGIRAWSLGRVVPQGRWTHVWQQEFARVEDLLGDYMLHPCHWGWVDRWFDPESPHWIVDTALCHAFCPITASVLASR